MSSCVSAMISSPVSASASEGKAEATVERSCSGLIPSSPMRRIDDTSSAPPSEDIACLIVRERHERRARHAVDGTELGDPDDLDVERIRCAQRRVVTDLELAQPCRTAVDDDFTGGRRRPAFDDLVAG